ncbi:MAG: hypothetical protein RR671_04295 [Raoultibacter sp.]
MERRHGAREGDDTEKKGEQYESASDNHDEGRTGEAFTDAPNQNGFGYKSAQKTDECNAGEICTVNGGAKAHQPGADWSPDRFRENQGDNEKRFGSGQKKTVPTP